MTVVSQDSDGDRSVFVGRHFVIIRNRRRVELNRYLERIRVCAKRIPVIDRHGHGVESVSRISVIQTEILRCLIDGQWEIRGGIAVVNESSPRVGSGVGKAKRSASEHAGR